MIAFSCLLFPNDRVLRESNGETSKKWSTEGGGGDPAATKRVLGTTERLEPRRREPPPRRGGGRARYREREGGKRAGWNERAERPRARPSCAQSQIRKPSNDINYIVSSGGNEWSAARRDITRLSAWRARLKGIEAPRTRVPPENLSTSGLPF